MSQDWKKSLIFIYIPISSTFSHDNNSNKRLYICISLSFISSIRRTESMRSRPIIICEGQNVSCSSTDRNSPTQSHPTLEYLHCTGLQPKQQDWVWIKGRNRDAQIWPWCGHKIHQTSCTKKKDTEADTKSTAGKQHHSLRYSPGQSQGSYLMIIYAYKTLTLTLATPKSPENIKQEEPVKMHKKSDYLLKLLSPVRHFA